jgi:hypothetical protein
VDRLGACRDGRALVDSTPMKLLVFTVVGLIAMMIAYAFSLGGTVASLIFLFIIFNAVLDRWAKPLLDWLRA